ncbi:glutathione S-transferase [Pseudomonas putida]|uniref:glutathione S-transferase family protein n=1 Tax=Pseudomonas TaxID=286 RepID=UPI00105A08BE|nr:MULTISPECIES: glutathione S-transferase [Pseudomonas]MCT8165063.1 glutathione S-transferase [Pseudomonas sp. HD6422]MCT8184058.1 glutathione S-transferase [Pseudomonas sp. HD6421]TDJ73697.1 glutathione S-transferase [Pseudomonas putida]
MIKLYNFPKSGHAHRIDLMLSLLDLPAERVFVDLAKGAHKTPEFLAMNPFGQVPVLDDNGTIIADSNAILVYLASTYDTRGQWLPRDPLGAARVQRWLSVAAGLLAFGPAAARLNTVFGASFNSDEVINRAHTLLKVMDAELGKTPFLVGNEPTIADIANYSYIAHAPEGNVSLDAYPHVRAWLNRIEALPGFIGMPRTAVGLETRA